MPKIQSESHCFRLDTMRYKQLKSIAQEKNMTVGGYVRRYLEKHVDRVMQ